jgi:hypothetical protein
LPGSLVWVSLAWMAAVPRSDVGVDWSGVGDRVIAQCGLEGLQNVLLQRLVEENYAVVREPGPLDVRFLLHEDGTRFLLEARSGQEIERGSIAIPDPCDSTIVVPIAHEMLRLVGVVFDRAHPIAPKKKSWVTTSTRTEVERPPHLLFQGGAGFSIPGSSTVLFTARASVRHPLLSHILGGIAVDASIRDSLGVLVVEPVLGFEILHAISLPAELRFTYGLEAGPLGHVFERDGALHGRLDGRIGVPLELSLPILGAGVALMPYLRFTPVEQRVLGQLAYGADRIGILLVIFVSSR